MTNAQREESEAGKFSLWVHVKNWVSDYLKATDIDIDGNKYVSVNVKSGALIASDLNIDGSKNVGINVKTITEEDPDAATKNNGCYSFEYYVNGQLKYIFIYLSTGTWRKALTYSSDRLTNITDWVKM